jgi:hypothetical protein
MKKLCQKVIMICKGQFFKENFSKENYALHAWHEKEKEK